MGEITPEQCLHSLQYTHPPPAKFWWDKHPMKDFWLYKWRAEMYLKRVYKNKDYPEERGRKIKGWTVKLGWTTQYWKFELMYEQYILGLTRVNTINRFNLPFWLLTQLVSYDLATQPYTCIKVNLRSSYSNKLIALGL